MWDTLDVLKDAVEECDDTKAPNFITKFLAHLEALLAKAERHIERGHCLAITTREAEGFEVFSITVHHIDDNTKATSKVIIEDATALHDWLYDMLEEIPHALADCRLVVDKLAEAS